MPYTWITDPPVEETRDLREFPLILTEFRDEIRKCEKPSEYTEEMWRW